MPLRFFATLILLIFLGLNWPVHEEPPPYTGAKMKGISLVAPPSPFKADPIPRLQQLGVDWIAAIPFGFSAKGFPRVQYDPQGSAYQWWGERPEGTRKTIQLAKARGLKVMLKPQLYVPGDWPGGIDFDNEEDWRKWERDYEEFILFFADIANEENVDLLCIGTEFKIAVQKRTAFWLALVDKIKERYCGALTYAANWDEYYDVPLSFWRKLDFAGVDAYFPLLETNTPSVAELRQAWKPKRESIRAFHRKIGLPVIFTEYGYLSVNGCAGKAWELEKVVRRLPVNEQAQANAIEAIFQVFWEEPYWAGSFLWKWYPNLQGHNDYLERDYSPQGKRGEKVLSKWFEGRH